MSARSYDVAHINTDDCIGCVKCIEACPFDAILGALWQRHYVLTDHCVGCEKCLPPCPVQCIQMIPTEMSPSERQKQAVEAKERYHARKKRLEAQVQQQNQLDRTVLPNVKALLEKAEKYIPPLPSFFTYD